MIQEMDPSHNEGSVAITQPGNACSASMDSQTYNLAFKNALEILSCCSFNDRIYH